MFYWNRLGTRISSWSQAGKKISSWPQAEKKISSWSSPACTPPSPPAWAPVRTPAQVEHEDEDNDDIDDHDCCKTTGHNPHGSRVLDLVDV